MKEKVLLEWKVSTPSPGIAESAGMWSNPLVILFFMVTALAFFRLLAPALFGHGLIIFIVLFYCLVWVIGLLLKKWSPKLIMNVTFRITNKGILRIPMEETRVIKFFLVYHKFGLNCMGALSPNTRFYKPFTGIKYYRIRNQKIEFVSKL